MGERRLAGMSPTYRYETLTVQSQALRGNPWNDPTERTLHLLVPDDEGKGAPYPVIWVLGGYSSSPEGLLADDPWSEGLQRRVSRLSAEGRLEPAIFALPDCFTSLGGSQYLDSPAVGNYERYLWEDCRPALEARYDCGKHGVTGKSSGGFGALMQAFRHPEHVSAVACHAGDMGFEYCYLGGFPLLAAALERHGGLEGFLGDFRMALKKRSGAWFEPIQTLCMAACYSPDSKEDRGIALPFDPKTAAIRPEIWERWLSFDPVRMIDEPEMADRLRRLNLLFLDAGTRDEYQLHWGLRQFVAKLRAHSVPHEHEEFDDGHRGTSYRYDVSLPKLAKALRR